MLRHLVCHCVKYFNFILDHFFGINSVTQLFSQTNEMKHMYKHAYQFISIIIIIIMWMASAPDKCPKKNWRKKIFSNEIVQWNGEQIINNNRRKPTVGQIFWFFFFTHMHITHDELCAKSYKYLTEFETKVQWFTPNFAKIIMYSLSNKMSFLIAMPFAVHQTK